MTKTILCRNCLGKHLHSICDLCNHLICETCINIALFAQGPTRLFKGWPEWVLYVNKGPHNIALASIIGICKDCLEGDL